MEPLIAVAGLLFVAAITPGPNNAIVLTAAARSGLPGALPSVAGVLIGSLALLVLVWSGAGVLFDTLPALRRVLLVAGVLYLGWLGGRMIWQGTGDTAAGTSPRGLPGSALGVAAFQLLNPKAWVLVTTAAAAMPGGGPEGVPGLAALAAMMVVIPGLCLALWAVAGATLAEGLRRPEARRRFDRIMGSLLIVSAVLLLAGQPAVPPAG